MGVKFKNKIKLKLKKIKATRLLKKIKKNKVYGRMSYIINKYYAFLYKGLEHLQILVSEGDLEPVPHRCQDMIIISFCPSTEAVFEIHRICISKMGQREAGQFPKVTQPKSGRAPGLCLGHHYASFLLA